MSFTTQEFGIVIPSYNEGANIVQLVRDVTSVAPRASIVVVDDSPRLDTVQALAAAAFPQVQVIHRAQKGGRGSAVIEGIRLLVGQGKTVVMEMDADFSHPPQQIPELLEYLRQHQFDLVIASRYMASSRIVDWPLSRRIFSKCSNKLARFVLEVPISDYTNGFRVYSRRAAEIILQECGKLGTGFISLSEILVNVYYRGLKLGEVPTIFVNRLRGESSLNFQEIKNALVGLVKIYRLKKRLQEQFHISS